MRDYDIIIIGGGAAGFFTAINAAERLPDARIAILERGKEVLNKVRISGGGRCNVTHAEFVPEELIKNYPRGKKELRGPFHKFMTGDTISWFEARGVKLKIEEDGRIFPQSNSSQTIIDCFQNEVSRLGVEVLTRQVVQELEPASDTWIVKTQSDTFRGRKLVVASGSNPKIWSLLKSLGHSIIPPVPSLFTFNIDDDRIKDLPGISTNVRIQVMEEVLESRGPLLITHWGMSGPAILRLSAWGARELSDKKEFSIKINWLEEIHENEAFSQLRVMKQEMGKRRVVNKPQFGLPKRLWQSLCACSAINPDLRWAELTREQLDSLAVELTAGIFKVKGKSTFKEEFVTAGGIDLKEIDFRTFQSKILPNLYMAGEVLNIDAITGGFNFQNAWTGGYLVSQAL